MFFIFNKVLNNIKCTFAKMSLERYAISGLNL